MEYQSPGYAFSTAMEDALAKREASKRQAMMDQLAVKREDRLAQAELDSMQERRDALAEHKAEAEQKAHDREVADFEKRVQMMVPGDVPDKEMKDKATKLGMVGQFFPPSAPVQVPGPTETGQPLVEAGPAAYIGSRADREAATKKKGQEAYAASLPEGPLKQEAMFALQMGRNPTASAVAGPWGATEPVVRVNPRTGKVETIGDVPKGSHFVQEPAPKPEAEPDAALGLTDKGLDIAAKLYAKTGQLPPMGMGKEGAKVRTKVINRAADYNATSDTFAVENKPGDIASAKALYGADSKALSQLQPNLDAVTAFTNAAEKNAKLLDDMLDKLPDTGSTFGNWLERGVAKQFGSTTMAKYSTFRKSLQDEYARIISNPNLTGVLSDTARKEMEIILDPNSPVKATRSALEALHDESKNRKTGYQDQIDVIKKRIKGGPEENPKLSADELIKKYGG
jgi:hypothetical protein